MRKIPFLFTFFVEGKNISKGSWRTILETDSKVEKKWTCEEVDDDSMSHSAPTGERGIKLVQHCPGYIIVDMWL